MGANSLDAAKLPYPPAKADQAWTWAKFIDVPLQKGIPGISNGLCFGAGMDLLYHNRSYQFFDFANFETVGVLRRRLLRQSFMPPYSWARQILRKPYTRDAYAPLLCRGIS